MQAALAGMTAPAFTSDALQRRIFIVDDHPLVRESLRALINRQPDMHVIGEAANGADAFNALLSEPADVVVVDIGLPGESGLELIKGLQSLTPRPRALVVSMYDEAIYAERALRAGALGYVMKHETTDKVIDAIRAVAVDTLYLNPTLIAVLAKRFIGGEASATGPGLLTDRELEIFALLGRGLDNRRIAEELHLSIKTIQAHGGAIREKLGLESMNEVIREAVRWLQNRNVGGA